MGSVETAPDTTELLREFLLHLHGLDSQPHDARSMGLTVLQDWQPMLQFLRSHGQSRRCAKGQLLFLEGQPARHFYFIARGMIRLFHSDSAAGREDAIHFALGPECIAENLLFQGNLSEIRLGEKEQRNRRGLSYPAGAEVLEDATLLCLDLHGIQSLFAGGDQAFRTLAPQLTQQALQLAQLLATSMSRKLNALNQQVRQLGVQTLEQRLWGFLLREARRQYQSSGLSCAGRLRGELSISKGNLARYLACSPETLSRALKRLQKKGLLEIKGRHFTILKFVQS